MGKSKSPCTPHHHLICILVYEILNKILHKVALLSLFKRILMKWQSYTRVLDPAHRLRSQNVWSSWKV